MTRRSFLVPLFAAAFVLAPSELSGQARASLAGKAFEVSPQAGVTAVAAQPAARARDRFREAGG